MNAALCVWTKWVPPRFERTADGTATLYFGFGLLSWRTPQNRDAG